MLRNLKAIVTGGGRAIGRTIALRLARAGADVAVAGLDVHDLEATRAEIEQAGRRGLAVVADVSSEAAIRDAVKRTREDLGRIDILVNNAAVIGPTAPVHEIDRQGWDDVLSVNLTGTFLCCKAVLPHMIAQRSGKIINIASIAGKIAYPLRSPYAVSKWGLIGLTLTLAKEVGPYNIQVNAVCPGPVEGERMQRVIQQRAQELGQTVEQVRQTYIETTVLKRMVTADDVAAVVAFLASLEADNITGQTIDVTAGYAL